MNNSQKFCPSCGKQLPGEARFCDDCGTNVAEIAASPVAPPPRPASAPSFTQAQPQRPSFSPSFPKVQAAGGKWTGLISVLLAIFLILSTIVGTLRGALYNGVVKLNVNKLYDEVYDEFDRGNLLDDMFGDVVFGRNTIDDAVDFFDNTKVKKAIQEALNSMFDVLLTGNPKKFISEDEVEDLVKSVSSQVNNILGEKLSSRDIEDISDYITSYYLGEFYSMSNRMMKESIEEFWEDVVPEELQSLRTILHPATKNILLVLNILAIAALIFLNLGRIGKAASQIGIPLIIAGVVGLILALMTGVLAGKIADETIIPDNIVEVLLGGYTSTAVSHMLWFLIIGIVLIVLKKVVLDKSSPSN